VFTPSTLANLEEVFNYSQIPTTVTNSSEVAYSIAPFVSSSNDMKPKAPSSESDFSDEDDSGSDYAPSTKRGKTSFAASIRSASPDLLDSQPLRRRKAMRANDSSLSSEDYARVMQRRERNKLAAARCRQRRLDLIDKLKGECDALADTNQNLESTIDQLRQQKDHLEFLLQAHQSTCMMSGVGKSLSKAMGAPIVRAAPRPQTIFNNSQLKPLALAKAPTNMTFEDKPNRPTSLLIPRTVKDEKPSLAISGTIAAVTGIPITTPSSLLPGNLGFDLLLDGNTPLVPINPMLATPMSEVVTPSTLNAFLS